MKYYARRRVNGVEVVGEGRTQHQADVQADINACTERIRQAHAKIIVPDPIEVAESEKDTWPKTLAAEPTEEP